MMKLRHLFDNRDLALMILGHWDYDLDRVDALDGFRISANAVYPFFWQGQRCFLRFAPATEKTPAQVQSELDFLSYLEQNHYSSIRSVAAKNGKRLMTVDTPWGTHVAAVFVGVPGKAIEQLPYGDRLYQGYGRALAKLHDLSERYRPSGELRRDWRTILTWTVETLHEYAAPESAIAEAALLMAHLEQLPQNNVHYGLIHYDFELDNVFYDEASNVYTPIDFDDAMVSWYAMDVEQALNSIQDELPPEQTEAACHAFLMGYQEQRPLNNEAMDWMPAFRRFVNLYGYARIIRSVAEQWEFEPDWMQGLRKHLAESLRRRASAFGHPL